MSDPDSVLCGIFRARGVTGKNAIRFEHLQNEYLNENQFVPDVKEYGFQIMKDVVGEIHRCNITDKYISSSKKIPLYYIVVRYYSKLTLKEIFKLYLYFEVNNIESEEQLMNEEIEGKFMLEAEIDGKPLTIDENFGEYRGNKKTKHKLKILLKQPHIVSILKNLMKESDEKDQDNREAYYAEIQPPKVTFSLRNV